MEPSRAIEILRRQKDQVDALKRLPDFSNEFKKWQRDTEVAIERIFGNQSRHKTDFSEISYGLIAFSSDTPDSEFRRAFLRGLDEAISVLSSMIDEISEYGAEGSGAPQPDALSVVENICHRFHLIARQLRSRYGNRNTIEVEDEYDVQDLLHGVLRLHFNDIRREEWTPSYAGGASRVDFLLKAEQIIIEVKKTRKRLIAAEVGSQLLVDIARYKAHPDCRCLLCFVYDPEGRIGNPAGLETDLAKDENGFIVRVIVGPKGV